MILLCSLIIIILTHELGHFMAAKLFKCGVPEFGLGFGPVLYQKKIGSTVYKLHLLLLGGYVTLKDELNFTRSKYSFTNKTYLQKVIISYAGIGMNCLSSLIAYLLFLATANTVFLYFGFYSMAIGLSNALPIPALDGSYPIAFLFEYKYGKKRCYAKIQKLFKTWFKWLMIINILSMPYLIWMIYKGYIL